MAFATSNYVHIWIIILAKDAWSSSLLLFGHIGSNRATHVLNLQRGSSCECPTCLDRSRFFLLAISPSIDAPCTTPCMWCFPGGCIPVRVDAVLPLFWGPVVKPTSFPWFCLELSLHSALSLINFPCFDDDGLFVWTQFDCSWGPTVLSLLPHVAQACHVVHLTLSSSLSPLHLSSKAMQHITPHLLEINQLKVDSILPTE